MPRVVGEIEHRFRAYMETHGMLRDTRRLLLAVSGGADSMALGHLFARMPFHGEIIVGHVHHGLRAGDADRDAAFVEEWANRWGWRFRLSRAREGEIAARPGGTSVEMAARTLRQRAFVAWATEEDLDAVATGHTADDQAETILFRVGRGTGLRGLAGIPPSRDLGPGARARLVRPLLALSRREIREYLGALALPFVEDRTNLDTGIVRNRIREVWMPEVEKVNPRVREALTRLGERSAEVLRFLRDTALQSYEDALIEHRQGRLLIAREPLALLPGSITAEWLGHALKDLGADPGRLSPHHLHAVELLVGRGRGTASLPGGIAVTATRGEIHLEMGRFDGATGGAVRLSVPGRVTWGSTVIAAEVLDGPIPAWRHKPAEEEYLDLDRIRAPLQVRGRMPGDRFHPLGAPGHKKLKEFFRRKGIPPAHRDRIPIVESREEIIWVVGLGISELACVKDGTLRFLRLSAQEASRSGP